MKEIQTLVWCDLCHGEDIQEQATYRDNVVTLGMGKRAVPRSLDLCERHFKELLEPIAEALAAYGARVDDPATAPTWAAPPKPKQRSKSSGRPGPFKCGMPGCASEPLANMGSLGSHLRQIHDITVQEYRGIYGDPEPMTDTSDEQPEPDLFEDDDKDEEPGPIGDSSATCPECGKTYSHALGHNRPAQALGVHLARSHGIRSPKVAKAG